MNRRTNGSQRNSTGHGSAGGSIGSCSIVCQRRLHRAWRNVARENYRPGITLVTHRHAHKRRILPTERPIPDGSHFRSHLPPVHESEAGRSRHFAATHISVAFGAKRTLSGQEAAHLRRQLQLKPNPASRLTITCRQMLTQCTGAISASSSSRMMRTSRMSPGSAPRM